MGRLRHDFLVRVVPMRVLTGQCDSRVPPARFRISWGDSPPSLS